MFLPAISGRRAHLQGRRDRRARRNADRDAFEPRHVTRRFERGLTVDLHHLVDHRRIEHGRNETGADPLDFVRSGLTARQNVQLDRLDGDHLQPGTARLQHFAGAGMVPPVPTPETITSTSPCVSFQISSAVVRRWISGLAGFSNCCGIRRSASTR